MNDAYRGDTILDNLHIRLFTAARIRLGTEWDTHDVQSSYWRFYRNTGNGAALIRENGSFPLCDGQTYLVPAGVRFSCHNTRTVEHFFIHFDVIGLPRLAMRELFDEPVCVPFTSDFDEEIQRVAFSLESGKPIDLATQCALKSVVYRALARVLQSLAPERLARYGLLTESAEAVIPALRHIERHLAAPLTNAHLAELCCLSENYFIRRFRECVGQSPAQYILEQRVVRAAQRLLFTEESIETIAAETGFGNRSYFSRVFARRTGYAPAAYRRASRV